MLSGSTEHLGVLGHCHQEDLPESLWRTKEEWVLGGSHPTVQVKVWEREAGRMTWAVRDQKFAQSVSGLLGRQMWRATQPLEGKPALEVKVRTEVGVRLGTVGLSLGTPLKLSIERPRLQLFYPSVGGDVCSRLPGLQNNSGWAGY